MERNYHSGPEFIDRITGGSHPLGFTNEDSKGVTVEQNNFLFHRKREHIDSFDPLGRFFDPGIQMPGDVP